MTTTFNIARDVTGTPSFLLPYSDQNYYVTFVLQTVQHFVVPSNFNSWIIYFNYLPTSQIYIAINEDVIIPSDSGVFPGSPLNPRGFRVNKGDEINFVSSISEGDLCTFSLYAMAV